MGCVKGRWAVSGMCEGEVGCVRGVMGTCEWDV